MDLKQTRQKLKEIIFLKKGTGFDCEEEERTLKEIEDRIRQEDEELQENKRSLEEKERQLKASKSECHELKEKLVAISQNWQEVALKLFGSERKGEELFDERAVLCKMVGIEVDQRLFFERTFNIGSQRVRWVDESIDPVTEDFRKSLILDNRDYFKAKRPKRRVYKKPVPKVKFIPQQVAEFLNRGIKVPGWMEKKYYDWLKEEDQIKVV